eukprot:m.44402 g.44402  ORF g.44402 m.44402 type:complete len:436 (+) comp10092_c0_seq1:63-1370(+)
MWVSTFLLTVFMCGTIRSGFAALPALGVRQIPSTGNSNASSEFVVKENGKWIKFVPRGANYIRLYNGHSTFNLCNDLNCYNRTRDRMKLEQMAALGYNFVRVFVSNGPGGIDGNPNNTAPVDVGYVRRMALFSEDAAALGMYTMITLSWLPNNEFYAKRKKDAPPSSVMSGWNAFFLSKVLHEAWASFVQGMAQELKNVLGENATSIIISLQNELFLWGNQQPFASEQGLVSTAAGVFDMAKPDQREKCMHENVALWGSTLRSASKMVLPNAFVTIGFFTNWAVQKNSSSIISNCNATLHDCRYPGSPAIISQTSTLDFLDVHIYMPDGSLDALDTNLLSEDWKTLNPAIPILLGEFGCTKTWQTTVQKAADLADTLQANSCLRRFAGWLYWTWDSDDAAEQPNFWSLSSEGMVIGKRISPKMKVDPCSKSSFKS